MHRLPPAVALLVVLALLAPAEPVARTWSVDPDGTGDAPTIQAAIDSAAPGDTVLLESGAYTGEGNRDITYAGKAVVVRSASLDPAACVIDCEGAVGSIHRGFSFTSGEGPEAVLEGVTIRHGRVEKGGGVYCAGASPTIRNTVFHDNYAWDVGGGLYCGAHGDPTLEGCVFIENRVDQGGGGAHCAMSSEAVFDGVTFLRNRASGGGAIAAYGDIDMIGCRFEENRAGISGGAAACMDPSAAVFRGCEFVGNIAEEQGGGAYLSRTSSSSFVDCTFSDSAGLDGGGLYLYSCRTNVLRCRFEGCAASLCGGGYAAHGTAAPEVDSCVFLDNRAGTRGGGVYIRGTGADAYLRNSLIAENAAARGGGIYIASSDTRIGHNTLCGNTATEHGGGICCGGSSWPMIRFTIIAFSEAGEAVHNEDPRDTCSVVCCDFFGNAGGDWTGEIASLADSNGNQTVDPLFCDAPNGDFTLMSHSPCADAPECGLVGALGVGCVVTGGESAVGRATPTLLAQPSPAEGPVTLRYAIPGSASPILHVYDIRGRVLRVLRGSGAVGTAVWDGKDASGRLQPSGVYFVRIEGRGAGRAERVVLIR